MSFGFFHFVDIVSDEIGQVPGHRPIGLVYHYLVVLQQFSQRLDEPVEPLDDQRVVLEVDQNVVNSIDEIAETILTIIPFSSAVDLHGLNTTHSYSH